MNASQDNLINLEPNVLNNDICEVENPIVSKTKGQPKWSRHKGMVEVMTHEIVLIRRKLLKFRLFNLLSCKFEFLFFILMSRFTECNYWFFIFFNDALIGSKKTWAIYIQIYNELAKRKCSKLVSNVGLFLFKSCK